MACFQQIRETLAFAVGERACAAIRDVEQAAWLS
jgi:hypothetical protein